MQLVFVLASAFLAQPIAARATQDCSSEVFVDGFGAGTPGTSGIPRLVSGGAPLAGAPYHVALAGGAPSSVGMAIASANEIDLYLPPFGGSQHVGTPFLALQVFALDAAGAAEPLLAVGEIPPALCGFVVVAQAAVLDGAATGGWSLSTALRVGIGAARGPLFAGQAYFKGEYVYQVRTGDLNEDGEHDVVTRDLYVYPGRGDGTLGEASDQSEGVGNGGSFELADFDLDGHLDAVVVDSIPTCGLVIKHGAGDGTLSAPVSYAGTWCDGLDVGDFDLDGWQDVAASSYDDATVSLLLNAGDGTLTSGVAYAVGVGPDDIEAADFDQDGLLDVASANEVSNSVSVLLNGGGGAMLPALTTMVGTELRSLVAGDVNEDGAADLVLTRLFSTAHVYLSNGDGFFTLATTMVTDHPNISVLKDFDADGHVDVALGEENAVTLWLGSGDGTFAQPLAVNVNGAESLQSEDLDGDGILDLVVGQVTSVAIRLGLGGGLFRAPDAYAVFQNPTAVAADDLNGDGRIDVAVASDYSPELALLRGTPQGKLGPPHLLPAPDFPGYVDVVATDLDADGTKDLVAASKQGDDVSVYFGTGGGSFAAAIEYGDLSTTHEPTAVVPADLDGDGALDLLVSTRFDGKVAVLRGVGGGVLAAPVSYTAGKFANDADVADLDADGFLDVVVGHDSQQMLSLLLGNGDGTLAPAVQLPDNAIGVDVADLDGDGIQDLAAVQSELVTVRMGLGGALFGAPSVLDIDDSFSDSLTAADVTGDGVLDLVVLGTRWVSVLQGLGAGEFAAPLHFESASGHNSQSALAVVDLDENGMLDVVAPDAQHEGITVFRNLVLD